MPALPLLFLQKRLPSLLPSAWFAVRCFSFDKKTVLVVFFDYSIVTSKSFHLIFHFI